VRACVLGPEWGRNMVFEFFVFVCA
jgi:hypothetical protein